MGDSGPAHQVITFFYYANDLHTGGILQVVHTRDSLITWTASVYHIGSGSQVYGSFLGKFPKSHGDVVDDERCFSSTNGWSIREYHPDFRGHAMGIRLGS